MKTKVKTELEFYQELKDVTDEELQKARDKYKFDLFFSKKSVAICFCLIFNHLIFIPIIVLTHAYDWQIFTILMLIGTPLYVELFEHKKLEAERENAINGLRACKDIEDERNDEKEKSPVAEKLKGAA